ncbi:sialic acid-binding Ig-like lectin 6 [Talpa occidentalis]|uniref:sialic acid-binding Ig-like lectin 6 n=1 Tax=Talpa occidentalis TaxID=50954 RepID=UPI0018903A9A|nr:sialic acid-binding Ig-like lectin 6 [Talpa occidentalis]
MPPTFLLLPPLLLLLLLPLWGAPQALAQRRQQQPVTAQEGLCALVPCSFSNPYSLYVGKRYGFWFQKGADVNQDPPVATNKAQVTLQERTRGRFSLIGDPQGGNCSLSIRDVTMGDRGTYIFATDKFSGGKHIYAEKQFSLKVIALTHKPHIYIPGALESGRPRNLTCSVPWACERGTPPIFSWTSAALASLGPRTLLSSALSLTPRPQDHGTPLTCQVTFPGAGVTVETTVRLNVTYAPQHAAINVFQGNSTAPEILPNASSLTILEGQAVRLRCVAEGNPPAKLSWFWGSPGLNATPISSSSTLELLPGGTPEEGELTCLVQHPLGSQRISLSLRVQSPPRLLGPSCSPEDEGLLCLCSVRARPAPSLRWRLGEQLLEGNSSNASVEVTFSPSGLWANSSLRLSGGLSTALRLSCEAQNPQGTRSAALLLLPGRAGEDVGLEGEAGLEGQSHKSQLGGPGLGEGRDLQGESSAAGREGELAHREHSPGGRFRGAVSRESQELHYAFLRFHKLENQRREDSDTVYSEIKTDK